MWNQQSLTRGAHESSLGTWGVNPSSNFSVYSTLFIITTNEPLCLSSPGFKTPWYVHRFYLELLENSWFVHDFQVPCHAMSFPYILHSLQWCSCQTTIFCTFACFAFTMSPSDISLGTKVSKAPFSRTPWRSSSCGAMVMTWGWLMKRRLPH